MYAHRLPASDPEKAVYTNYVKAQTDYYLGDNEQQMSYVIGFGQKGWPTTLLHSTAHGAWAGHDQRNPNQDVYMPRMRHTIYGALVGGPGRDDGFVDGGFDHTITEPVISSAGRVQTVAAFLTNLDRNAYYPVSNFPPPPQRSLNLDPEWTDREMYVAARISSQSADTLTLDATLYNRSAWPARVLADGAFRYYFTADAGESAVSQFSASASDPDATVEVVHTGGDRFYVEVGFPEQRLLPARRENQRRWRTDVQITLQAPSGTFDPGNDWSARDLDGTRRVIPRMPVYGGGQKIEGEAP